MNDSSAEPSSPAPDPPPLPGRGPSADERRVLAQDRYFVGRLLGHGAERHEHNPRGPKSYYVSLNTADGKRTLWHHELEGAFHRSRSHPQVGDVIGVRENSLTPATVVVHQRRPDGSVVSSQRLDTPRPHWVIEKLDAFDARASMARMLRDPTISRREAVMAHRELSGAYWILDSAAKLAKQKWNNRETRDAFLAAVRESLALTIERAEDATPTRRPPERPRER